VNADTVLILLGHGSKAPETLEEMRELAAKLQRENAHNASGSKAMRVQFAFLTLLQPDLAEAIAAAAAIGVREIRVLPLFFFSGKHVLEDIPAEVARAQAAHPAIKLVLLETAGRHPDFLGFVAKAAGLHAQD
jgi:sirohydrochlorin ferrochelatase